MVKKIVLIVTFLFNLYCFGKDKGVYGELFEIEEKDLLEEVMSKLKKLEENGELKGIQEGIQKRIVKNIEEPRSVEGVIKTKKARIFEFDPTIELTEDLKDQKGKIFARKGDKHNALDYITYSKTLLFIDGEDEEQIEWAKLKLLKHKKVKIILVKGKPLNLQERLKRPIYFDQYGIITKRVGVKQVPARVWQEEGKKVLTVSEELASGKEICKKEKIKNYKGGSE